MQEAGDITQPCVQVSDVDTEILHGRDASDIKFTEDTRANTSGVKIYRWIWAPVKKAPRALLFITHGYAEHSGRYNEFARSLCSQLGCLVFSHDLMGHGKSDGERVMVQTFNVFVDGIFEHVDEVRKGYPDVPVYLFGHSMGGSLAILASCKSPEYFQGVVLSAPAIIIDPSIAPGAFKRCLGNILNRFFPGMEILAPVDPNVISSDPEQAIAYHDDPLIWHGGMKLRFAKSFEHALAKIKALLSSIEWPFLVLHGDCDKLTYVGGSELLGKDARSKDKQVKIYKGLKHEILNEVKEEADRVQSDIVLWLKQRIPTS